MVGKFPINFQDEVWTIYTNDIVWHIIILSCSANVQQGRTALECAIVCGHSDTVQLLLTAGADANLENPLVGLVLVLTFLLNIKSSPVLWLLLNRQTGQSPLVCAAVHRRYQEMKLLQHHGAQINRPGSKVIARLLLLSAGLYPCSHWSLLRQDGCTAMHVICKLGDADGFSTLIIKGARVTSIDDVSAYRSTAGESAGTSLAYAIYSWQWIDCGIFCVGLI
jgi:ankyrin repeat protein